MASIYDYLLGSSSPDDLDRLYSSPWCTLAVYEHLDGISQQIIMRLLCIKGFVAYALLRQWLVPTPEMHAQLAACVQKLRALRILGSPDAPEEAMDAHTHASGTPAATVRAVDMNGMCDVPPHEAFTLSTVFRASLQTALSSDAETPWQAATAALPSLRATPSEEEIEAFAASRWHAILHFLVGSYDAPTPEAKTVELLVATRLMAPGVGGTMEDTDDVIDTGAHLLSAKGTRGTTKSAAMTMDEIMAAGGGSVHVTKLGHEFLLKDTSVQLWTFVNEYLATAAARGMKITDILAFLFELGFCRLGAGYSLKALTVTQKRILPDFRAFGLVYVPSNQEVDADDDSTGVSAANRLSVDYWRFYPTSLAVILTRPMSDSARGVDAKNDALSAASSAVQVGSGVRGPSFRPGMLPTDTPAGPTPSTSAYHLGSLSAGMSNNTNKLHLVVEKNFKVYAYTNVDLHLALLGLFAKLEVRLPNLVVATLTRRSVMQAFDRGISAAQLEEFLVRRAHPATAGVPENVIDQLYLWERERHRVTFRSAVWLHGFDSVDTFQNCYSFLDSSGALLWSNTETRNLVFYERSFDSVKALLSGQHATAAAPAARSTATNGTAAPRK